MLSQITVYSDMMPFSLVYKYQHTAYKTFLSLLQVE